MTMAELPLRRRERIARHIQEVGAARTEDLAARFDVSAMTIHRDLDALEAEVAERLLDCLALRVEHPRFEGYMDLGFHPTCAPGY